MIVRFWSARVLAAQERKYLDKVREIVLPEFEKLSGYHGSQFLKRDLGTEIEYRVLTFWDSLDAVKSMAGEDPKQAFIPDEIALILKRFDTIAEHFERVIEHRPSAKPHKF